jgi:S-adenosyl-L-methionine hydrolase (adenosine-forming)
MAIISLLTDFGTTDEYAGVMKGVIANVNPAVQVVDISHGIGPQNIEQAALVLKAAFCYFPAGTVHVAVVDPGVGSSREVVALELGGYFFVGPDNGVFTPLFEEKAPVEIVFVRNENYFLKPVSNTFHGRDIFAPVAAHISKGVSLNNFGPAIELKDLVQLSRTAPYIDEKGVLIGHIADIDRFGNLVTDIEYKRFSSFLKTTAEKAPRVCMGTAHRLIKVVETYQAAAPNEPLALLGSRGYLEVAINKGSAQRYFRASIGHNVTIELASITK